MKIGINIKIDVTKIEKARLYQGEKGTYLDLTTFIDTENVSQYGDNGIIAQSQTKEEREGGTRLPILGNCKVFYKGESQGSNAVTAPPPQQAPPPPFGDDEADSVPF